MMYDNKYELSESTGALRPARGKAALVGEDVYKRQEKNRKGIYRVPGTVHPHGSQLGRPVITAAVFDPLHID